MDLFWLELAFLCVPPAAIAAFVALGLKRHAPHGPRRIAIAAAVAAVLTIVFGLVFSLGAGFPESWATRLVGPVFGKSLSLLYLLEQVGEDTDPVVYVFFAPALLALETFVFTFLGVTLFDLLRNKERRPWTPARVIAVSLTAVCLAAALVVSFSGHELYPPQKPSSADVDRVRVALEDYTKSDSGGQAKLDRLEVELETQSQHSDLQRKDYFYHAYFDVEGTDAVVFMSFPHDVELSSIPAVATHLDFTDDELAVLQAYSKVTSTPAELVCQNDLEYSVEDDIWLVQPASALSPDEPEYTFERLDDGTFRLLESE
ncbi:MAG: hypothetical protein Q8K99_01360 [Actinomycetota bacterium]|nr:hypothetical protein [Actinomycetota bacterium]